MALLGICWAVYRWLRKRTGQRVGSLFLVGIGLLVIYTFYTALYPDDEFYREKYEQITLLPFPASGRIIKKAASYPDVPQGHYRACALVEVAPHDYQRLQQYLTNNPRFSPHSCILGDEYYNDLPFERVAGTISCTRYAHGYAQKGPFELLYVGLLNDGKSLVIYRFSI
ncbi:hypothetical protein MUN84_17475 [Hymenobacter sp. 5516J-16]|uniref:hypothetical protein n=1 Tax=Hymenobacter sp. 5516J-16 TaxID=2932253 RepID=UPI001FD0F9B1|nr:hypothetical protein [Hymenobacter sp. 5516J-16]UOQ76341.1 hypothetical protein MUN84_17475 [Hymenobacter sp. 5516J-16]